VWQGLCENEKRLKHTEREHEPKQYECECDTHRSLALRLCEHRHIREGLLEKFQLVQHVLMPPHLSYLHINLKQNQIKSHF
jgi:hypothetical protein